MKDISDFYKQKIVQFETLKEKCQRPDRVTLVIDAYKQELQRLGGSKK